MAELSVGPLAPLLTLHPARPGHGGCHRAALAPRAWPLGSLSGTQVPVGSGSSWVQSHSFSAPQILERALHVPVRWGAPKNSRQEVPMGMSWDVSQVSRYSTELCRGSCGPFQLTVVSGVSLRVLGGSGCWGCEVQPGWSGMVNGRGTVWAEVEGGDG